MLLHETNRICYARVKSFNRYSLKALENKPVSWSFSSCPVNSCRKDRFHQGFFQWNLLSFIHIHAKYVRWGSAILYFHLAGIHPIFCGRETLSQPIPLTMRLILYFSTALPFLSRSKYTCYSSLLSWITYLTPAHYLLLRYCSCLFPAQGSRCPIHLHYYHCKHFSIFSHAAFCAWVNFL